MKTEYLVKYNRKTVQEFYEQGIITQAQYEAYDFIFAGCTRRVLEVVQSASGKSAKSYPPTCYIACLLYLPLILYRVISGRVEKTNIKAVCNPLLDKKGE